MRTLVVASALAASLAFSQALAQASSTHGTRYSTADTTIGTLMDDPAARAVVDKVIPGFSSSDQLDIARAMTLKTVNELVPDRISAKQLADIDAGLAKLPSK